jgi:hypothetical protein
MEVLSQRSSVCSVERLRSFNGRVWGDLRASLGAKKALDVVLTGSNIRLKNQLLAIDLESEMRKHAGPETLDEEQLRVQENRAGGDERVSLEPRCPGPEKRMCPAGRPDM